MAMFSQLGMPSSQRMRNEAPAMSTELRFVPSESERNSVFMLAFSFVRTANMPRIDRMMPTAAMSIGAMTALNCASGCSALTNAAAPRAEVARMEPQYDS